MSLVTAHWSVSPPGPLGEYHEEFWLKAPIPSSLVSEISTYANFDWHGAVALHGAQQAAKVGPARPDAQALKLAYFDLQKNDSFSTATSYGTWDLNNDPRDGSPNIEVAMMGMNGESVSVTGPWGANPYTYAHFFMHAEIIARICKLKNIDPLATFDASVEPSILQNGPIPVVSTHGERAIMTQDPAPNGAKTPALSARYGYFAYSGDPDCRWDLAAPTVDRAMLLGTPEGARAECLQTAAKLRALVAVSMTTGFADMWGLDV